MRFQIDRSRRMMSLGAPLAGGCPDASDWRSATVVQGGLRILENSSGHAETFFRRRPVLRPWTGR